jgi:regulatory protein
MKQKINESTNPSAVFRSRALEYLSRREYSVSELAQKLEGIATKHGLDSSEIPKVLEDLKSRGWLSDERYAEQILHARKAKFGSAKIAHELREHGVSEEIVESALSNLKDAELDRAKEVWKKKFDSLPNSREIWAKQARFLQSRGFGFDVIKKVLNQHEDELSL